VQGSSTDGLQLQRSPSQRITRQALKTPHAVPRPAGTAAAVCCNCISRFPIPALGFFYHIPTYSVNLILELQSKNSSSSMWIKLFVRLFVFILSGVSRVQINTKEDLAM